MNRFMVVMAMVCGFASGACGAAPVQEDESSASSEALNAGRIPWQTAIALDWDHMSTEQRVDELKTLVDQLAAKNKAAEARATALRQELDAEILARTQGEEHMMKSIAAAGGRNGPSCTGNTWFTLAQLGVRINGLDMNKYVVSTGNCL